MIPNDEKHLGEVLKSITSLPDRKATGVDIIGNEALKMVGDIVTPYLEDIFSACLSKSHYPKWLKFSRTTSCSSNLASLTTVPLPTAPSRC